MVNQYESPERYYESRQEAQSKSRRRPKPMAPGMVGGQLERLKSRIIPHWEDQIEYALGRRLQFDIRWASFKPVEVARAGSEDPLTTLCASDGAYVFGRVTEAIQNISSSYGRKASDFLARRLVRVRIVSVPTWDEMDCVVDLIMDPELKALARGRGTQGFDRTADDSLIQSRIANMKSEYELIIKGVFDRGFHGLFSAAYIRGTILEAFDLGPRAFGEEIKHDIRRMWEERLRFAVRANVEIPFVINWPTFQEPVSQKAPNPLKALHFGFGELVFARVTEALTYICSSDGRARDGVLDSLYHIRVKNIGTDKNRMKCVVQRMHIVEETQHRDLGRADARSVISEHKAPKYVKLGRIVHVLKLNGAFDLGESGCHDVDEIIHCLASVYGLPDKPVGPGGPLGQHGPTASPQHAVAGRYQTPHSTGPRRPYSSAGRLAEREDPRTPGSGRTRLYSDRHGSAREPLAGRRERSRSPDRTVTPQPQKFISPYEQVANVLSPYEKQVTMFQDDSQHKVHRQSEEGTKFANPNGIVRHSPLMDILTSRTIPMWEDRLHRFLLRHVPINIDWASFQQSPNFERALETVHRDQSEYVLKQVGDAIASISDQSRKWEDAIARNLIGVKVAHTDERQSTRCMMKDGFVEESFTRTRESSARDSGRRSGGGGRYDSPSRDGRRSPSRSRSSRYVDHELRSRHQYPTEERPPKRGMVLKLICNFHEGPRGCWSAREIEETIKRGLGLGKKDSAEEIRSAIIPYWERKIQRELSGGSRIYFKIDWDSILGSSDEEDALATLTVDNGEIVFGRIHDALADVARNDPDWQDIMSHHLLKVEIRHNSMKRKDSMKLKIKNIDGDDRDEDEDTDYFLRAALCLGLGEVGVYDTQHYRDVIVRGLINRVRTPKSNDPDLSYLQREIEEDVLPHYEKRLRKATRNDRLKIKVDWVSFANEPSEYTRAVETLHAGQGKDAFEEPTKAIEDMAKDKKNAKDLENLQEVSVDLAVHNQSKRMVKMKGDKTSGGGKGTKLILSGEYAEGSRGCFTRHEVKNAMDAYFNMSASGMDKKIAEIKRNIIPYWEEKIKKTVRARDTIRLNVDWGSIKSSKDGKKACETMLYKQGQAVFGEIHAAVEDMAREMGPEYIDQGLNEFEIVNIAGGDERKMRCKLELTDEEKRKKAEKERKDKKAGRSGKDHDRATFSRRKYVCRVQGAYELGTKGCFRSKEVHGALMELMHAVIRKEVEKRYVPQYCEKVEHVVGGRFDIDIDWKSFDKASSWFAAVGPVWKNRGKLVFPHIADMADDSVKALRYRMSGNQIKNPVKRLVIQNGNPKLGFEESFQGGRDSGGVDTVIVASPFETGERSEWRRETVMALRHAIITENLPRFGDAKHEDFDALTKVVREAAEGPQTRHKNWKYISQLVRRPCFWQPTRSQERFIQAALKRVRRGEQVLKAWMVFKVARTDREGERVFILTDAAVYVIKLDSNAIVIGKAEKERSALADYAFSQIGDFQAVGSVSAASRNKVVANQSGLRIYFKKPGSGTRELTSAERQRLIDNPKDCVTIRGLHDRDHKQAERAQMEEIDALLSVVLRTLGIKPKSASDTKITRKAKFGFGRGAAAFNSGRRGLLSGRG